MPAALYLLSLCKAVENSDFSFGVVSRLDTQSKTFQLDSARLIHSWNLRSCIVDKVIHLRSDLQPEQWAQTTLEFLRIRPRDELEPELQPILDLATEYLNRLLIASMIQYPLLHSCLMPVRLAQNPGGKKTPQESTHPTPDLHRLHSIKELLDEATINRKRSALKTLVSEFLR